MTDFFTNEPMQEGDIALIVRNDGRIQIAARMTPDYVNNPMNQTRIAGHIAMITGAHRMMSDDKLVDALIVAGTEDETIQAYWPMAGGNDGISRT